MATEVVRRAVLASLLLLAAWALEVGASPPPGKSYRVVVIEITTPVDAAPYTIKPLRAALAALGYVEGRNLTLDVRHAHHQLERLPDMLRAAEASRPDVIVAIGTPTVVAAAKAVKEIPVVMMYCYDPVELKVVRDLKRPGGNLTGICLQGGLETYSKTLEVARAMFPSSTRFAFLTNGRGPRDVEDEIQRAAARLGVGVVEIVASTAEALEPAFAQVARERASALIVPDFSLYLRMRHQIVELAARTRTPAVYQARYYADIGGLVSNGLSVAEQVTEGAAYVDRILRGARPGDLPVQLSRRYEVVVNLDTARQLGIKVAPEFLLRADEVIGR